MPEESPTAPGAPSRPTRDAAVISLARQVRLLRRSVADLARSWERGRDATRPVERRQVEALERIAAALERLESRPVAAPAATEAIGRADRVRWAIEEGLWEEARRLAAQLAAEEPGSAEAAGLIEQVERGRESAAAALRARLDASQAVNDSEAVLDYRRQLAPLLSEAALRELDRDLLRWLLALLMKRMRTGTVRADVASLATRVAETFPETPEGASLRASLPTLRRSAGLCARCARPYTGVEDACPECLAAAAASQPGPTILPLREDADEVEAEPEPADPFEDADGDGQAHRGAD